MRGPPARSGELNGLTGALRRPRFDEASFWDLIPPASLRHTPDPTRALIGPRTGDRLDEVDEINPNENRRRPGAARATDAARRPSQRLTRPMRLSAGTTDGWGSRFPRSTPARSRHPAGIELCDKSDRCVGTERFLGRRASARQSHQRKLMGPDPVRLFGAARRRVRHRCRTIPVLRGNGWPARKRLNKHSDIRRSQRRIRNRCFYSSC